MREILFRAIHKIKRFLNRHKILRVILFIFILWFIGAFAMYITERRSNPGDFGTLPEAFWSIIIYLTSGFERGIPLTIGGKIIATLIITVGIGIIGIFTATIASILVERELRERRGLGSTILDEHIVLCGWNNKGEDIIRELHAPVVKVKRPAVIISEDIDNIHLSDEPVFDDVHLIKGDPADEMVLRRAGADKAYAMIILADPKTGELADAKSILVALAVDELGKGELYVCAEVVDSKNIPHLKRAGVNEIISSNELGEKLLSQVALTHGLSQFFTELLTYQESGNEVYMVDLPLSFVGRTFRDILIHLVQDRVIAVGIKTGDEVQINPPYDYRFNKGDKVFVIAFNKPDLDELRL